MLKDVYLLLEQLLNIYWWVVVLSAVVSNLIAFGVLDTRNRIVWTIADFLYRLTEPALRRIRSRLPNMGGLDLSPLILLVIIWLLQMLVAQAYSAIYQASLAPLLLGN